MGVIVQSRSIESEAQGTAHGLPGLKFLRKLPALDRQTGRIGAHNFDPSNLQAIFHAGFDLEGDEGEVVQWEIKAPVGIM